MDKASITAMATALANEGVNFPGERAERMIKRLMDLGWEVTKAGKWEDWPAQVPGLVQDEI